MNQLNEMLQGCKQQIGGSQHTMRKINSLFGDLSNKIQNNNHMDDNHNHHNF